MIDILALIRDHIASASALEKFALALLLLVFAPRACRWLRVPESVLLLAAGMLIGPHGLGVFGTDRPVADFMAELGQLLLMFFIGLEIDLVLFRRMRNRSLSFGLVTASIPLILGAAVALAFDYALLPAIAIGSLLASHTLLGLPAIRQLGQQRSEPVTVAIGATVTSDTISLVVFAACVSAYTIGFRPTGVAWLLTEILGFFLLMMVAFVRLSGYVLSKVENDEHAYFIVSLAFMIVGGALADAIPIPGIVGAFLAGLAVNAFAQGNPAMAKLEFMAKSLFIPIFFVATGFLIDPAAFGRDILVHGPLILGILAALLIGKGLAAAVAGRAFGYTRYETLTVWSLTLPQVATTLAATLVALHTLDASGRRLLDAGVLNTVLVVIVSTSIVGPLLTQRFASRVSAEGVAEQENARRSAWISSP